MQNFGTHLHINKNLFFDEVKNAIFGNVGSLISFKVGVSDAEFLEKEFEPVFNQKDLINLENRNTYVKTISKGEVQQPFSMQTVMTDMPSDSDVCNAIIRLSRLKYGKDVNDVEAEIKARGEIKNTARPAQYGDILAQK